MRVISLPTIREYWESYEGANQPALENSLKAWYYETRHAEWNNANEIKQKYGNASILKNGRVVFNICGNNFRLIVGVNYGRKIVYIKWIGTHEEYDAIDAEEV